MIVYGHNSFDTRLRRFSAALHEAVTPALDGPLPLSTARELLVWTGQLEQGVADHCVGAGVAPRCRASALAHHAVMAAATAFLHACGKCGDARAGWRRCARALLALRRLPDCGLRINSPEGFSHYGLFPEQYIDAAQSWLADHPAGAMAGPVAVVGLRTIGTTLSALVAAALSHAGVQVRRCTVRPGGHPYARCVDADATWVRGAVHAIVVDEGPGLSGSSMAAAADWLARAGVDDISVFPSHAHGPGAAASAAVRAWWASAPRYLGNARCELPGSKWIEAFCGEFFADDAPELVEDMSAGGWRAHVYADEHAWPAALVALERPKYRCLLRSGRRVLMKFCGFDAYRQLRGGGERTAGRLRACGLDVLGERNGFIFAPWCEEPLPRLRRGGEAPRRIARYLAAAPVVRMSNALRHQSWERLKELTYCNVQECLGERYADAAMRVFGLVSAYEMPSRAAQDYRLAPQEWRERPDGEWRKVSAAGAVPDVSAVGEQSIAWDLAGAAVEWKMKDSAWKELLKEYHTATGERIAEKVFICHRLAYGAFHAGACKLGMDMRMDSDPETYRLTVAYKEYVNDLSRWLE